MPVKHVTHWQFPLTRDFWRIGRSFNGITVSRVYSKWSVESLSRDNGFPIITFKRVFDHLRRSSCLHRKPLVHRIESPGWLYLLGVFFNHCISPVYQLILLRPVSVLGTSSGCPPIVYHQDISDRLSYYPSDRIQDPTRLRALYDGREFVISGDRLILDRIRIERLPYLEPRDYHDTTSRLS